MEAAAEAGGDKEGLHGPDGAGGARSPEAGGERKLILKELELTNIRSHGHSVIRFPPGRTLLEGDIGSGKSSVLMAIEFALFGLGSDSGSSVLKLGRDSGEVRLVFDVGGSEYEVTRRLQRKGGRVQQSDGYLRTPAETLNLSPSELKEKVLEVLEFNEAPDPKAQSWIYRYAVYTPQEEMKNILSLASEQRLQILRRAFRVEDYKTAAMNAEETAHQIRVDAAVLDGISKGIDDLRTEAGQLRREEEVRRGELKGLEGKAMEAGELVAKLKAEKEENRKREVGLQGTRVEKEYYERIRRESAKEAAEAGKGIKELKERLAEIGVSLKDGPGKSLPHAGSPAKLKQAEHAAEARAKKLTALLATVESKLSDYESIMKNGVCPVCDRPAEAHEFEERRMSKDSERKHVSEELESAERELDELRGRIRKEEEFREARKEFALSKSERSRLRKEIARKEAEFRRHEKRGRFASTTLLQLATKLEELGGVVEAGREVEMNLARAEEALRDVRDDLARGKEKMESVRLNQVSIAREIVTKEEAYNRSRRLKEREIWLEDYFLPTLKAVEKSVLAAINQEFDLLFKRWFAMLVDDQDKEVSVDEDFAPIVSQGGYEQDVRYLSGGERTSVALAYRLALNMLAQRVSVGMKSNLLILDEPTEGFSKEQLGNVREVLDEVGSPQVILVSHDKELESFADQIFRVEKTGSESMVRTHEK